MFTADETDVSAFASHDHTPGFERDFVGRSPDFHTTEEYLLRPDGTQVLLDVPPDSDTDVERSWLLVRHALALDASRASSTPPARCCCFDFEGYLAGDRSARVLFAPDPQHAR